MNAHNLAMVALNARMQHERNYNDEQLAKRGLKRLDIDPKRVEMGWVLDFCAQGLRNIIIGIGGPKDGYLMESKSASPWGSELMAILSVARDLKDLRERIGKIVVAYSRSGGACHHRGSGGGRRHDRLDAQHHQPPPSATPWSTSRCSSTPAPSPTSPSGSPPSSATGWL